jgi:hypothetical protein
MPQDHPMGGIAFLVLLIALWAFWSGARPFLYALIWARHGVLHVPALALGALGLWGGGILALLAGTLTREPPAMPDEKILIGWTIIIAIAVLTVALMRRPDVEERLPEKTRRLLDGRYVAVGAVVAVLLLFALHRI